MLLFCQQHKIFHYTLFMHNYATLVCACGNSTGSLLLPPPLFSKPVAPPPPPPPQTHRWRKLVQHAHNTKHLD